MNLNRNASESVIAIKAQLDEMDPAEEPYAQLTADGLRLLVNGFVELENRVHELEVEQQASRV